MFLVLKLLLMRVLFRFVLKGRSLGYPDIKLAIYRLCMWASIPVEMEVFTLNVRRLWQLIERHPGLLEYHHTQSHYVGRVETSCVAGFLPS